MIMDKMFISKQSDVIIIKAEHFRGMNLIGYSLREAEAKYREEMGLKGVHFKKVYRHMFLAPLCM